MEVEAPGLRLLRVVAQVSERDLELRHPADVVDVSSHFPTCIPVEVESSPRPRLGTTTSPPAALALVGYLTVVLQPGGVGPEDETILPIVIGIQNNEESVHVIEVGVAPGIGNDDAVRIAVVADDAKINGAFGVEDSNFRLLRCRLALVWLGLNEVGDDIRLQPNVFVDPTVDHRSLFHGTGKGNANVAGFLPTGTRRGQADDERH